MTRKLLIAVGLVAAAGLSVGCSTATSSADGGGQLEMASAGPSVRLGAGDQLGENMFRHYTEVRRRQHERLAESDDGELQAMSGGRNDASDNARPWFVVLPRRGIVVFPGRTVLQATDSHVTDAATVHQLLPS